MRLIQPIFASYSTRETGLGEDNKIFNAKDVIERVKKDIDLGVKEFLLFYIPEFKLFNFDQVCETAASLSTLPIKLNVDVCLCSYTDDGHCCVTGDQEETDDLLLQSAVEIYSASGATVAPSDCQDNTVKNIKAVKDGNIDVMSYSTKFRSTFYRGWRDVMKIPKGIHRPYQLDVSDRDKAIIKSVNYADDGADELMVKPGMTSIDLIGPIKQITGKPCGVFQVSGEWLSITKPEQLLERIILSSSNEGDLILDPFAGCNTTGASANMLNRKWVIVSYMN